MSLLTALVKAIKQNAFFLVVDPASSFSDCVIGAESSEERSKYRIFDLLDNIDAFEKVKIEHGGDSVWYRPEKLVCPIKIQSMRYGIRLYRKK